MTTRTTRPARAVVAGLLAAVALATGCTTLPTSGDVHTEPGGGAPTVGQAPDFVPPGPVVGADRAAIVRGFLLATQANPPSTSVARAYLTEAARSTWKPAGALVYASSSIEAGADAVVARLSAANRIDRQGSWQSTEKAVAAGLSFNLVLEQGEWRIQNPPTALPLPTSYFRSTYLPYLLYFFDRTGTVLVPSRVYLPRGEQVASSLVRGLLAGPNRAQEATTVNAFSSTVGLDLSVVIGEDGVAEVPLSADVQDLSRADLYRAVVQLSATLRQVPGLRRIRVTVDGVAIPLVDGQTDVGLDVGPEFDPVTMPGPEAVAIADGKVVLHDETGTRPVGGPFGENGFALRSIAASARENLVAAVAGNGRRAFQAPTTGDRDPARVRTVLDGASNLLRPAYDRFGNLWLVDAARSGAVVRVVVNGRARVVDVDGITGQRVVAFTITRDGASLVAGLEGPSTPTVAISPLLRTETGRPVRGLEAHRVPLADADLASVVDLAQDSATGVVVLTRSSSRGGRLFSVETDGSPGPVGLTGPPAVPGDVAGILAGPDDGHPALVVAADGRLLRPSTPLGEWVPTLTGVVDASYPQ